MNYGQAPAYGTYAAPPYAGGYAMQPYRGQLVFGQTPPVDPNAPQTTMDKIKAFGAEPTLGIANQWWLLGAAVVGGAWWMHSRRMF